MHKISNFDQWEPFHISSCVLLFCPQYSFDNSFIVFCSETNPSCTFPTQIELGYFLSSLGFFQSEMTFRDYDLDSRRVKIYIFSWQRTLKSLVYFNISNSDLGLQEFLHNFFGYLFLYFFYIKLLHNYLLIHPSTHNFKITMSLFINIKTYEISSRIICDSCCQCISLYGYWGHKIKICVLK